MPTATQLSQTGKRATRAGAEVARGAQTQGRRVAKEAADEARQVASTAADRGGAVVQDAKQEARQLVGTIRERASDITDEVSAQGRSFVEQAQWQLKGQASSGVQRTAGSLRSIGEEAQALAEGRVEDAPQLTEYLVRAADGIYGAADRLSTIAEDVEVRGFTGVLDDLQTFARRRPGAFLFGAAALGFGLGRMVKAEKAQKSQQESDDYDEQDEDEVAPRPFNGRRTPLVARSAR